jgi:signal transduction histidine kinase/CheY-like chemotaxis protein
MDAPEKKHSSSDPNEEHFRAKFSLRQAFSLTNLVILLVGALFSLIILGFLGKSKREETKLYLANQAEIARLQVDEVFQEAEHVARSIAEALPVTVHLPAPEFHRWFDRFADERLAANTAQYDIYYGLSAKAARRLFRTPGMVYLVKKDSNLAYAPGFNDPRTFERLSFPDPSYLKNPEEVWYHGAVASPDIHYTPPWFDQTYLKRVMISVTKASRNEKGELLGIGGVDISAGSLSSLLMKFNVGETGGIFFLDQQGRPIAPFIGRDVPMLGFKHDPKLELSPDFHSTVEASPVFDTSEEIHEVDGVDGERYLYQVRKLSARPFRVVAYQRRSEAYAGLYWTVSAMVALAATFLAISLFLRQKLANFVVGNIRKILENIESNRAAVARAETNSRFSALEPSGPTEVARISHQLNLLYDRLQRAFTEIQNEKERAELATRAKSRFLSVMSHEIRTPLNSMLGLTDVLLLSPLNPEQVRHLNVLQRSGQSLLRILNDILDFSRLEAGKLQIESHEFDLYELLYDVESLMRFDAEAKGLRFTVLPPASNFCILGDSIRLRQALLNLVGNAIKFTAAGGITIRVSKLETEADGGPDRFQFEVEDTGIGMSKEEQAKVFSEFSQADASITRRYGGTGLGLVISRQIVELLGGSLRLESKTQKGSTFTITIPLIIKTPLEGTYPPVSDPSSVDRPFLVSNASSTPTKVHKPDTRVRVTQGHSIPTKEADSDAPSDAKRILIVDDDEDNHRLIDAYLKFRPDLHPDHAFSAQDALAKIRAQRYHLVVMDMQMPEMDGLEATAEIRRLQSTGEIPKCPVVMLSANTFAEDQQKSLESGADEHVGKPIKLDRFQELLKRWLA